MTEKRFVKGYHTIRDTKENNAYDFQVNIICDLLNELNDENEQLKKQLESFKPIIFESDGKPVTLYKKGDVE